MLPARNRTATILTFGAAALVLYLAAFPPFSSGSSRKLKHTDAFKVGGREARSVVARLCAAWYTP